MHTASFRWRSYLLFGVLACSAVALVWRAVELQLVDKGFLQKRGTQNYSRVIEIASHRGTIVDRYGEPLAVSTPVDSIYANPKELALASDQFPRLAKALKMQEQELTRRITSNLSREFLYLARHLQPADAQKIKALDIPGVYVMREYRRYYPATPTSTTAGRKGSSSHSITGSPARMGRSASSRIATAASCRTSRASAPCDRAATSRSRSTCASST